MNDAAAYRRRLLPRPLGPLMAVLLVAMPSGVSHAAVERDAAGAGVSTGPPGFTRTEEGDPGGPGTWLPAGPIVLCVEPDAEVRRIARGLLERAAAEERIFDGPALFPIILEDAAEPVIFTVGSRGLSAATKARAGIREELSAAAGRRGVEVTWMALAPETSGLWAGEGRPMPAPLRNATASQTAPLFLFHRGGDGLLAVSTDREVWASLASRIGERELIPGAGGEEIEFGAPAIPTGAAGRPVRYLVDLERLDARSAIPLKQTLALLTLPRQLPWRAVAGSAALRSGTAEVTFRATPRAQERPPAGFLGAGGPHPLWSEIPADALLAVSVRTASAEGLYDAWLRVLADGDAAAMAAAEQEADAFFGFSARESLLRNLGPEIAAAVRQSPGGQFETWFLCSARQHESIDRLLQHLAARFEAPVRSFPVNERMVRMADFGEPGGRLVWEATDRRLLAIWSTRPVDLAAVAGQLPRGALAHPPEPFAAALGTSALCMFLDTTRVRDALHEEGAPRLGRSREPPGPELFPLWMAMDEVDGSPEGTIWLQADAIDVLWLALPSFSLPRRRTGGR